MASERAVAASVVAAKALPDVSTAEELLAHPRFDAAMREAAAATVELYRGHWALNRLLNDRGRFVLGLLILDLHFNAGAGAGFNAAQLRAEALRYGVCSPGRMTAFLAALRLVGFLQIVAADDQRLRRLVPTERFLALHRDRWRHQFTALGLLRPEGELARAALDRPDFAARFAHGLASQYRVGVRLVGLVPELREAAERDCGIMVLLALWVAEDAGKPASIAALATRFSVSRAHVLTVLREAEQAGLVCSGGRRGGYRATPALTGVLRRFFANGFLMQLCAIQSATSGSGGGARAAS